MSHNSNAYFTEDITEGARCGLLCLMTGVSEELWAAGWMSGLEFALWDAVQGVENEYGRGVLSERELTLLRLLSEEADGWWIWSGESGPTFVDLETWNATREKLRLSHD